MTNEIITTADRTMGMIERFLADPDSDPKKLTEMLNFQREVMKTQNEIAFNQAFARLIPQLPRIKKNGEVCGKDGKKMFTFAKYEDIDTLIRPLLLAEGFSLSFTTEPLPQGGLLGHGKLLHVDGHSITASMPAPVDTSGAKNAIQGIGSTFSYLKRYLTTMLLNLVFEGEDDDAKRGGTVYIDAKSAETINQLLEETKSDRAKFLQWAQVAEVENIEAKDFTLAVNMLHAKKRNAQ